MFTCFRFISVSRISRLIQFSIIIFSFFRFLHVWFLGRRGLGLRGMAPRLLQWVRGQLLPTLVDWVEYAGWDQVYWAGVQPGDFW